MLIGDINTAIISLMFNEDRRNLIKHIPNAYVNAYNGKILTENYLQNELIRYTDKMFIVPYSHPITLKWKCRMACFLSHLKTLSTFSQPTLILEDDIVSKIPINDIVLEDVPEDYDILQLGGFYTVRKGKKFIEKEGWNRIDTKLIKYFTTHSYIVRKPQELLKKIRKSKVRPTTLDIYYNKDIYKNLNCYFYSPSIIKQNPIFESTIDNDNKFKSLSY